MFLLHFILVINHLPVLHLQIHLPHLCDGQLFLVVLLVVQVGLNMLCLDRKESRDENIPELRSVIMLTIMAQKTYL